MTSIGFSNEEKLSMIAPTHFVLFQFKEPHMYLHVYLKAFIMRKRLEARKEISSLHSFKNTLVIGLKTEEHM